MFDYANLILQWCRSLGQRFFLRFGLHCATHQIRIILVSCVVITSLFYPALAIYTSTQPNSLSLIYTFKSTSTTSRFDAQKDLVNLWSSHHSLRVHEDAVSRAKCGVGRALRVERLLIQSQDDEAAVTRQTLLSTLDLEDHLEKLISGGDTPCLKRPDGKCLVLSPLLFWNFDRDALISDTNILKTLSAPKNISIGGIIVTPEMVLARGGSNEPHAAGSHVDFAAFLAITYFFPESDCLGNSEHTSWLQSVRSALAQEPEPIAQVQEPTLITLEYDLDQPTVEGWSALSAFIYLAYMGFFAYVVWSVGKMNAVHSRLGVTFTALVEIAVSTITSLSVCALVGFKITMVPWELLPIVIIFVGAENMFNLVDAVGKTSVTLSVKQRIAEGLSRAGTSNTLKVVSYNAILGVAAFFSVGAIRQFCVFAIVVLVAHWFLAHTFFLAVLSIDLQRLELDELLRHDSSLAPAKHQVLKENLPNKPRSVWQKLMFMTQNLLGGRAATNLSLVLLLAIMGTLYYTTYTASPFSDNQATISQLSTPSPPRTNHSVIGADKNSAAWYIWKTLNPIQSPLLHLRIEQPTIVTFKSEAGPSHPIRNMSRQRLSSRRTFRLLLWLLKIMVLPIAATTSALWGLLLYLLKDAELLEAQRNRGEPDVPNSQEDSKALAGQISFSTLPRAFMSDVELIAASKDGNLVISVGLHNEIIIWRRDRHSHVSIDAADVLLRTASTSSAVSTITSVAVDSEGRHCAVGTGAGFVAVWVLDDDSIRALPLLSLDNVSAAVTMLQFSSVDVKPSRNHDLDVILLATFESGVAAKWSLERGLSVTYIAPSRRASVVKCSLVPIHPLDRFLVTFSLDDGTLEVLDTQDASPWVMLDCCVQAGDAFNTVSKVHACEAELSGSIRKIIAVATEAGLVSLWDGSTGECISVFDDVYGRINQLQVTPVQCETCHFCGQLPLESICVAFSVNYVIQLFRLYLNDERRRCSCSRHPLRHASSRDNLGRRSRSNSISQAGSTAVSPSIPRARLATTFEMSAFPVSGHGVHSRRATEKDTGRRSLETLTGPFASDEYDSDTRPFITSSPSVWRDAILARVTDITCERGGWGVNGKKIVGVRRKPRAQGVMQGGTKAQFKAIQSHGLTVATLERWELWTYDLSIPRVQKSLLSALMSKTEREQPGSTDCIPRLPFTRVSPFLLTATYGIAGFGNTVGMFNFY